MATQWEYRNEIIDNDGDGHQRFSDEQLNAWGAEGWELVHVNPLQELGVGLSGDEEEALPGGGQGSYPGQTLTRPKRVVCWFKRAPALQQQWEYLVEVIDNDGDSFPTFSAEQMDAWGAQGWELQHVNPLQELSSVLTGAAVSANTASASTNGGAEYAGQTLTRPKRVVAWFKRLKPQPASGGDHSRLSDADEAAIARTANRYAHAIDIGDGDLYAACFTPDGTMSQQTPNSEHTGPAALRELFADPCAARAFPGLAVP